MYSAVSRAIVYSFLSKRFTMKKLLVAATAVAVLFAACEHTHEEDHDHSNSDEHELEALAYTLYTNKTELFVEFKPLVAGI